MFHYNALILYKSATAQRKKRNTKNIFPLPFVIFLFFQRFREFSCIISLYETNKHFKNNVFISLS
jgi:hypothetical protein